MLAKLQAHLAKIGVLLFILGVISFVYYPEYVSMSTYMSENALSPSWNKFAYSSSPTYSNLAISLSQQYYDYQRSLSKDISDSEWSKLSSSWIHNKLIKLHLEPKILSFPLCDSNSHNTSSKCQEELGYMIEVRLNAPRSLGAEAVMLTSRFERVFESDSKSAQSTFSWSLLTSFVHMLHHQHWRSKDVIMVLFPGMFGSLPVENFMSNLNSINFDLEKPSMMKHSFIIASLSLDIPYSSSFAGVSVKTEGILGNLPNLDLVNTIMRISYRAGIQDLFWSHPYLIDQPKTKRINTGGAWNSNFLQKSHSNTQWHHINNQIAKHILSSFVWLFSQIPVVGEVMTIDKIKILDNLFSFMFTMAAGVPNGDHSFIGRYKIDALTISAGEKIGNTNHKHIAVLLEGTFRSLNNLIEPLHQSFYFYLPISPFSFVPIGYYMISFGLLFSGFALFNLLVLIQSKPSQIVRSILILALNFLSPFLAITFSKYTPWADILQSLTLFQHISIEQAKSFAFILNISILSLISIIAQHVLRKYSAQSKGKDQNRKNDNKTTSSENITLNQTLASLSIMPLLIFIGCSSLINVSFAFLISITLIPILTFQQALIGLKALPRLFKLLVSLFTSPWACIGLYSYLSGISSWDVILEMMENWIQFSSLLFPLIVFFYLPLSISSIDRALHN